MFRDQLMKMERKMLSVVGFDLGYSLSYRLVVFISIQESILIYPQIPEKIWTRLQGDHAGADPREVHP
jgi:hypothetical protein